MDKKKYFILGFVVGLFLLMTLLFFITSSESGEGLDADSQDQILSQASLDIKPDGITHGKTWDMDCLGGRCTYIAYGGIRNVLEDKEWKKIENARSLKGSGIECIIEDDGEHLVTCLDWNYTSITYELSVKSPSVSAKEIPIKIYKLNDSAENETWYIKNEESKSFSSVDNLKEEKSSGFVMGDVIHFGENSTTIVLGDPNSEVLDDTYIEEEDAEANNGGLTHINFCGRGGDVKHGLFKFNISEIPANMEIENSIFTLYLGTNGFDSSGEGNNISARHLLDNITWEESADWNGLGLDAGDYGAELDFFTIFGGVGEPSNERANWTVTGGVTISYEAGLTNTSLILLGQDSFGSPSGGDCDTDWRSKEHSTTSTRPILFVTFSPIIAIDLDLLFPTDLTGVNESQNEFFNVTVNVTCRLNNCNNVSVSLDPIIFPFFVDAGSIVGDPSGSASTTPSCPTHQANDILIVTAHNSAGTSMSTSTEGWTEIIEIDDTDNTAWYWKRAAGAGTAGPTVTSASTSQFAICYVIRGAIISGTPYEDATTIGSILDDNPDTAEITTTGVNSLAMNFLAVANDAAWSTSPPPAGWDLEDDQTTTTGTDNRMTAISKEEAAATTVSAIQIGEFGSNQRYASLTLAFLFDVGNKGGLIPNNASETPFYTNDSNPRIVNLSVDESQLITFWVNATGAINTTWEFFAYANVSLTPSKNNATGTWFVTIGDAAAPPVDTCTYGGSGNFRIDCQDMCVITTVTDLGGANLTLNTDFSGTVVFRNNITNYGHIFVGNSCQLYTEFALHPA